MCVCLQNPAEGDVGTWGPKKQLVRDPKETDEQVARRSTRSTGGKAGEQRGPPSGAARLLPPHLAHKR